MPIKKNSPDERVNVVMPRALKRKYDEYISRFASNMSRSEYIRIVLNKHYNEVMSVRMKEKETRDEQS